MAVSCRIGQESYISMVVSCWSRELYFYGCVMMVKRARFLWLCHYGQGSEISLVVSCWSRARFLWLCHDGRGS